MKLTRTKESRKEFMIMAAVAWALVVGINACLIGAARLSYEMFKISYGRFEFYDLARLHPMLDFKINVAHMFAAGMYVVGAACLHLIQTSIFGSVNRRYLDRFESKLRSAFDPVHTERVAKIEAEMAGGTAPAVETEPRQNVVDAAYNINFNRWVCGFAAVTYIMLSLVSYFQAQRISLEERGAGMDAVVAGDEAWKKLSEQNGEAKRNLKIAQGGERDATLEGLLNETKNQSAWAQENRQKVNAGIANQRMSTIAENLRLKSENVAYWSRRDAETFAAMEARRRDIEKNFAGVERFANVVGPGLLELLALGGAIALAVLNCYRRGSLPIYPVRPKSMATWKTRRQLMRTRAAKERMAAKAEEIKTRREPKRKPGKMFSIAEIEGDIVEKESAKDGGEIKITDVVSPKYMKRSGGGEPDRGKIEPLPDDVRSVFEKSETFEELLEWYMISIPCPTKKVLSKVEAWIYLRGLAFCRFSGDQGKACKHKQMDKNRASRYYRHGLNEAIYYRKYDELDNWLAAINARLRKLGYPQIRKNAIKCAVEFPTKLIRRGMNRPYGQIRVTDAETEPRPSGEIGEDIAMQAKLLLSGEPIKFTEEREEEDAKD